MLSSWDLLPKIFCELLGKFVSMCAESASADKIDSVHGLYTPRTYSSLRYHVFASTISSESLLQVQPSHAMYPSRFFHAQSSRYTSFPQQFCNLQGTTSQITLTTLLALWQRAQSCCLQLRTKCDSQSWSAFEELYHQPYMSCLPPQPDLIVQPPTVM